MRHPITLLCSTLGLGILLNSCDSPDQNPPLVSITSPAFNSTATGQTPIQVTASDSAGINKVRVYARAQGSTLPGVLIGSTSQAPYVISWNTTNIPNHSNAEIYAEAVDNTGEVGISDPVPIKTSNTNVPALNYIAAFTIPKRVTSSIEQQSVSTWLALQVNEVQPPNRTTNTVKQQINVQAVDPASNTYFLEWNWNVLPGSSSYRLYASTDDAVGMYRLAGEEPGNPNTTTGKMKTNRTRTDVTADKHYFGVITAVNAQGETGLSNSFETQFMQDRPQTIDPVDGAVLNQGRPTLTWRALAGVDGYLYFVYNENPLNNNPSIKEVWSSKNQSIAETSIAYPKDLPDLPKGTYFWWVAGVKFNTFGQAYAFSYSQPSKFQVP